VGCNGWWCGGTTSPDWKVLDLKNPDNINKQDETTTSLYAMTNYGFDDLAMPIDGNVGVRIVSTDNIARGHITYSKFAEKDGSMPYYHEAEDFDAKNSYTNVLPSFNLRLKARDDLFFRFSASKAVWAPSFSDLQAKINLSVAMKDGVTQPAVGTTPISDLKFSLSQDTNPYLEPMQATQFDISTEWYFDDKGGMAHLALFSKDVEDFFRKTTSTSGSTDSFERYGYSYQASWLGNFGTGDIKGVEVGFSKFFDSLPAPFDGLGLQANYTYIDSKANMPQATKPIDTDQSTYGTLPIEFLSKDSFNIVGMYEKNGISARLAYTWRSKYLVGVGSNGFKADDQGAKSWWLPVYNDDYGQLDASIGYTFMDNYTINLEASNITKENTVGIMDQNKPGDHIAYVYAQDARYSVTFRAKF
jgi:TonB-dependent receptor